MKTDRELLELAAIAGGHNWRDWTTTIFCGEDELREWPYDWNPLTDDGDALRLATYITAYGFDFNVVNQAIIEALQRKKDPNAAARRAIVMAAANISESLSQPRRQILTPQ